MSNTRLCFRKIVADLPVHLCQKATYDWFLRITGENLKGKKLFDFGPGGYPFCALAARLGAEVSWLDRNEKIGSEMAALSRRYGVTLRKRQYKDTSKVDIVVASNAVQHNHTGAEVILRMFRDILLDGGCVLLSEKLAQGQTVWLAERSDPCWARTLEDHRELWTTSGLAPKTIAFFNYTWNTDPAKESVYWTSPDNGNQVVVELRKV